jgi:hypothetical protein
VVCADSAIAGAGRHNSALDGSSLFVASIMGGVPRALRTVCGIGVSLIYTCGEEGEGGGKKKRTGGRTLIPGVAVIGGYSSVSCGKFD